MTENHETIKQCNLTFDLKGSGNPPCGIPMCPCKNSTTDRGKESSSALSSTSAREREFCTINWARSPTILEEGVTWRNKSDRDRNYVQKRVLQFWNLLKQTHTAHFNVKYCKQKIDLLSQLEMFTLFKMHIILLTNWA